MCKIFELISKKALLSFLSETWAISPHQHGFFPRRSCLYNLLVLAEAVTRMMDEGYAVDIVSLILQWPLTPSTKMTSSGENEVLRS